MLMNQQFLRESCSRFDQPHEDGVLPHRSHRADKDGGLSGGVVGADGSAHLGGHLVKDLAGVAQLEDGELGALAQLLGGNMIVVHSRTSFCH